MRPICLIEFIAGPATERYSVGKLEALDVVSVDPGQWRKPLAIIGTMVHQPVLRLLVGVDEPIRGHVAGEGRHVASTAAPPSRSLRMLWLMVFLLDCFVVE